MCPPTASRIMGILGLWWQHKPQASTGFTVVVWTMEVFLGGLIQKMNHTCISEILLLLKVRVILPLGSEFGARACVSSGLLHTSLLALLHNDMFLCPLQPCRRQTCCGGISTSAPLHSEPAALFSHLSYLSIAHSSIKVIANCCGPPSSHIYAQTAFHANTYCNESLLSFMGSWVHGFMGSGFWNTINIGLLLRLILDVLLLPGVRGDLVDGECFQGAGSKRAPGCYTPPCLGAAHGYDHCLAGTTMVPATMLAASGQSHDPRAHLPTVGWAAATAAPSAPCFQPPRMNVLGNGYAPIPIAALLLPFFPISLIFCCSSDTACSADSSSTISSLLKVFVCLAASLEQSGAGSHFYLDS